MASLIHEPQRPRKPWRVDWWERGRSRTLRFASKREAEMFIGDLARGARGADATMTLIEWVPGWIKTRGLEWERRTRRDRANEMDRLILPWLGKERIGELTRRQIREWRAALIADGVTTYAAQHAVKTLSTCLGAAVDDDLIPANPCAGLRALQWTKRPQDPATIEDRKSVV